MRILLVEDNAMVREQVALALRGLGHVVNACSDPSKLPVAPDYDLVITDYDMPAYTGGSVQRGMGEEVVRWAATRMPDTPVIMHTGHAMVRTPEHPQGVVHVLKGHVSDLFRLVAEYAKHQEA